MHRCADCAKHALLILFLNENSPCRSVVQMLGFFGASLCVAIITDSRPGSDLLPSWARPDSSLGSRVAAASCFLTMLLLSWRRVRLGYHTLAQVIVGICVGSVLGCVWASARFVSSDELDAAILGGPWRFVKCAALCACALAALSVRWLPNHSKKESKH